MQYHPTRHAERRHREAAADLDETLRQVASIGYRTVEIAGFAGTMPQELRAALDALLSHQR